MIRVDGNALRRLRLSKNMTQGELVKASGVAIATLNALECGRTEHVADKTILALAKALGMTAEDVESRIAVRARAEGGADATGDAAKTGDAAPSA